MRKPDRKTYVFSSARQLPVPAALYAEFSTLLYFIICTLYHFYFVLSIGRLYNSLLFITDNCFAFAEAAPVVRAASEAESAQTVDLEHKALPVL